MTTLYFDASGEQIYPCRCGETHTGPYAVYDYGHHNCFHKGPLIAIDPEDLPGVVMCSQCGESWDSRNT
jgi:hypothetical protein